MNADLLQCAVLMQMFEAEGVDIPGFSGVPVFQAVGLTIKTKQNRYSPLFLDHGDLQIAIRHAAKQGIEQKHNSTQAKAQRAQDDLEEASAKVPLLHSHFIALELFAQVPPNLSLCRPILPSAPLPVIMIMQSNTFCGVVFVLVRILSTVFTCAFRDVCLAVCIALHQPGSVVQLENADSYDSRIQAQAELSQAEDRVARYNSRRANVEKPDIQIGTLEQLLNVMEREDPEKGQEVMFVPAGALASKGMEE